MGLRAVFFDFGGTLVEAFRDGYPAYSRVLGAHGYDVARARWAEADEAAYAATMPNLYTSLHQSPSWGDQMSAFVLQRLDVPDEDGRLVAELYDAFTDPAVHRPFPESLDVVRRIRRRGLQVHVVSNNNDYLPRTLARLGWQDLFDGVTFSQEAGAEKPDRRVFDLALRRAGCLAEEAVHVGDSWVPDYVGATQAGLRAVWLNRDGAPPPAPCAVARDLEELDEILRG